VQVLFHFVPCSSRIKVGKERFGIEQESFTVLGGPEKFGIVPGGMV
jgi:hypothetical protein